jgi:hypothetical protein
MSETKKSQKIPQDFCCELCNYNTSSKKDYNKHLLTLKHKKKRNETFETKKIPKKEKQTYSCPLCSRDFTNRSSLWRHKKICDYVDEPFEKESFKEEEEETNSDVSNMITPDVVLELLKQNQEFKTLLVEQQNELLKQQQENQKQQEENMKLQNQLLEAVKEGKTINNTTNNTNCNNKFNLNFFLNEQCKNAMNISEFIDNMVLSVDDLKNTGKLGYIDGITKIFTDKLKELDAFNRPMHCTDLKRETLYIKNNDEWSKDTEDKRKIKTAIECVANKNLNNLDNWKEENPNHVIMDSKEDKEFVEIMTNSLGGMGSDREKNKQKIIKNVLKEVIIDK